MPPQGIPSNIGISAATTVSCGQTYEAITIPELMIVMTRKMAIKRKNDGSFRCISTAVNLIETSSEMILSYSPDVLVFPADAEMGCQ